MVFKFLTFIQMWICFYALHFSYGLYAVKYTHFAKIYNDFGNPGKISLYFPVVNKSLRGFALESKKYHGFR